MKFLLVVFGIVFYTSKSFASEWATFYIYVQTEYIQGTWSGETKLPEDNYNYLEAHQHEALFGFGLEANQALVETIFSRLKKEDPERIKFKCKLSCSANYDTVIVISHTKIEDFDAVKNELVASYILNSFKAVKIVQPEYEKVYLLKDVSVPYMNLVKPGVDAVIDTEFIIKTDTVIQTKLKPAPEQPKASLSIWLILSFVINIVLTVALLKGKFRQSA